MMRRSVLAALATATLATAALGTAAEAQDLDVLIERNQKALERTIREFEAYDRQEVTLPPARLWVHKRAPDQDRLVAEIEKRAGTLVLPGGPIEFKPVQQVDYGPDRSQLRFFKPADRTRAYRIAKALREAVPELEVRDFTTQYAGVSWLKPGHFELWLAAEPR